MPRIPAPDGLHKAAVAKSSVAARPGRPGQAPSGAPGSQKAAASQRGGKLGSSSGTDSRDDSSGSEGSEEDSSSDEDEAAPSSAAQVAAQQPAPGRLWQVEQTVYIALQGLEVAFLQLLNGCGWLV